MYIDNNPDSPTYRETWVERAEDRSHCPVPEDSWMLVSDICEISETGYTGYRISIYYNPQTGEYRNQRVVDSSCGTSSSGETWENIGEAVCEVNSDGVMTGYKAVLQRQTNPNVSTYGNERVYRYASPDCVTDICAEWQTISRTCHLQSVNCVVTMDGTVDKTEIDVNPHSPSYNRIRTVNVMPDGNECENCTNTTFSDVVIGNMCGSDLCISGISADMTSLYSVSRKYKTIDGNTYPMDEYSITLVEAESTDCGYSGPQYRWVDMKGYACVGYDKHLVEKRQISYDSGETWSDYVVEGEVVTRVKDEIYQADSYDCGYPMYSWMGTDDFVCSECETSIFRWVETDDGRTICEGDNKYTLMHLETSCDDGETWDPVIPERKQPGTLIEAGSLDCNDTILKASVTYMSGDTLQRQECYCDGTNRTFTTESGSSQLSIFNTSTGTPIELVVTGCTDEFRLLGGTSKRPSKVIVGDYVQSFYYDDGEIPDVIVGSGVTFMRCARTIRLDATWNVIMMSSIPQCSIEAWPYRYTNNYSSVGINLYVPDDAVAAYQQYYVDHPFTIGNSAPRYFVSLSILPVSEYGGNENAITQ